VTGGLRSPDKIMLSELERLKGDKVELSGSGSRISLHDEMRLLSGAAAPLTVYSAVRGGGSSRMTRMTNARIAGFTFLLYIAAGIAGMVLFGQATSGEGIAVKLAGIAQHATVVRVTILLDLVQCFAAVVLAVTLYAITRVQDPDLAMLALTCRVGEGVIGAIGIPGTLGLLWLATAT
jgi:hypothetical protein